MRITPGNISIQLFFVNTLCNKNLIVRQANQPRLRPDSNLGLTNFYPELAKIW